MKTFRLSAILILALSLFGCGGGNDTPSTGGGSGGGPASAGGELQRAVVVIGDSIGRGFNASIAYPDIIASLTGIPVTNFSKNGSDAEFGVSRTQEAIDTVRPMFIVYLLGTNNAGGAGGGVSGAISALQFAANIARQNGVIPIIGTIPPISRSASENNAASQISAGIRGISNARIADINVAVSISDIDDGKHPNNRGQQIIGELFAQQVF